MAIRGTRGVVPTAAPPEGHTEALQPDTVDAPPNTETETEPVQPDTDNSSNADSTASADELSAQDAIEAACSAQEGAVYLRSTHSSTTSDGTMYDPYAKLYYYPGKATPTPYPLSSWMQLQLRAGLIAICPPDFGVRAPDPSSFNRPDSDEEDGIDE